METREYIVGLQKDINYNQFWEEMENPTNGLPSIPDRIVDIKDERIGSKRLCHYLLTDEEAKNLRKDPRVLTVEIPPSQRKDIKLVSDAIDEGNFIKDLSQFIPNRNWGLKRVRSKINNYGVGIDGGNTYEYILDGEGIDVVITDSGIDVQHPEFRNLETDTKTRVQTIDWYVEAGLAENVLNNLATSTTCCIGTQSHINFLISAVVYGDFLKNPFKQIIPKEKMGPGLVLGPMLGFGQPGNIKSYAIYTNSENNNKSFRIRYEGLISNSNDAATLSNVNLVWEVTFFDDNKLQINVIKYLGSSLKNNWPYYWNNMNWYLHEDTKTTEFPLFYDSISSPRTIVLTTEDNGHTWNTYGNDNTSYHVVSDGGNGWLIEEGAASELGAAGMTPLFTPGDPTSNVSNLAIYNFNTPFDFYVGNITTSPQSFYHYRDREGHGTHVAAIAAGKRSGWARNSKIYSMKLAGLEGPGDSGTGIPIETGLDLIKLWHMNKPIDPKTGYKRPTIVNMSWGYNIPYSNIVGGEYRGTPWAGNEPVWEYGMIGYFIFNNYHGGRVESVDIDIEEMIDEGIHVCIAAGNTFHKIDIPSGPDYNNYWTYDDGIYPPENIFYHRGSSPYSDRAFIVGAMDSVSYDIDTDQKASYSCSGPGVDLYAPGSEITSACSRYSNIGSPWPYWWDLLDYTTFWQQISISGTSMACPQVCGVGALILQLYPNASPEQLKTYLLNNAGSAFRSTGLDNDYEDWNTTHGGDTKTLYLPFGVNQSFNSNVNISGINITKK